MSMHGSMTDDPTDELSHNPFLSEARDEQPQQSPQRHQQHGSASVPTGPVSSSTTSASGADPLSQSHNGHAVPNAGSSSSVVMQHSLSRATQMTNGHEHEQNADESTTTQPQHQQQPARPRPTRLALKDNAEWKDEIKIVDAEKTREGSTSSFIQYILRSDKGDARRRYSEFESLRTVLSQLYPVLIIPPIPPHHSLTDYASKQGKAKEDANVIARRKRMLTVFLNRLGRHPILGEERVFQRFLEPNLPWSEVMHAPPVTQLPKNILKASARTPADPATTALYAALPGPSTSSSVTGSASGYGPALQDPDQRFLDSEIFTNKFSAHLSGSMEKVNRRLMKRWSDISADYAELGGIFNGFGLNEASNSGSYSAVSSQHSDQERSAAESLSRAIESTGQAVDSTYLNSNAMLQEWERSFTEPLTEYTQFSSVIKALLKYRHSKHLQFELTRDALETKKGTLEELERSEIEARRLDQALDRALNRVRPTEEGASSRESLSDSTSGEGRQQSVSVQNSPNLSSSSNMRKSVSTPGKFGFLGALSNTINGMVDADPDMTRRNNIGKTRDTINSLESSIQFITSDLRYANQMIQADLDRFQRQKVADIREMCISHAKLHQEWCSKNQEMWKDARKLIEEIDDGHAPLRDR